MTDECDFSKCPEHSGLEARVEDIKKDIFQQESLIQSIFKRIDEVKGLLNARPSWAVVMLFAGLTSTIGIMVTVILFLWKHAQDGGP